MPSPVSQHVAVMPREVLRAVRPENGMTVFDGTTGAAGHTVLIARQVGDTGLVIGCDRDEDMLRRARARIANEGVDGRIRLFQGSYVKAADYLTESGRSTFDAVLLDLGLSSDQLGDSARGFGFDAGGPLDMRFDRDLPRTAADLLQELDGAELADLLLRYGDETAATEIAAEVVRRRRRGNAIATAADLSEVVLSVRGPSAGGRHPAARVFQALRIAVNDELGHVEEVLNRVLPEIVRPGGRAVILTFHSIEDRLVKNAFRRDPWREERGSPYKAQPAEVRINPRSRSAHLRVAVRG